MKHVVKYVFSLLLVLCDGISIETKIPVKVEPKDKEAGSGLLLPRQYKVIDDVVLPSGFGDRNSVGLKSGLVDTQFRWPNATIVFTIKGQFSREEVEKIYRGMAKISKKTCVTFRKKKEGDKDFLEVTKESSGGPNGCGAFAGRKGGIQKLYLPAAWCIQPGLIAHELIHALGFLHEHQRTDRDDFVIINWDNIQRDAFYAFDKIDDKTVTSFGVAYDYGSLMHYHNWAFAINDSIPTIYRKDCRDCILGQDQDLTKLDAEKIRRMYNCK